MEAVEAGPFSVSNNQVSAEEPICQQKYAVGSGS